MRLKRVSTRIQGGQDDKVKATYEEGTKHVRRGKPIGVTQVCFVTLCERRDLVAACNGGANACENGSQFRRGSAIQVMRKHLCRRDDYKTSVKSFILKIWHRWATPLRATHASHRKPFVSDPCTRSKQSPITYMLHLHIFIFVFVFVFVFPLLLFTLLV